MGELTSAVRKNNSSSQKVAASLLGRNGDWEVSRRRIFADASTVIGGILLIRLPHGATGAHARQIQM
jgi:hypothetical protein